MNEKIRNNTNLQKYDFPVISIIILTYKEQTYLYQTLKSILEQDYPCIEVILSDDASGQLDQLAVEKYIENNKKRNLISYHIRINTINIGTVKHANLALQYAQGKYIKFVPCGDKFFATDSLSKLYKFAEINNSLVTSSVVMVCSKDFSKNYYKHPNFIRSKMLQEFTCDELFRKLCVSNFIAAVAILFRRDFLNNFKFDERYRLLEDWPLWLKLCKKGIRIHHLNEITMYYADGGISKKDGDAFSSCDLRHDMIKCYEIEILPYITGTDAISKHFIFYKYESLKGMSYSLYIKYIHFLVYDELKRLVKYIIKRKEQ